MTRSLLTEADRAREPDLRCDRPAQLNARRRVFRGGWDWSRGPLVRMRHVEEMGLQRSFDMRLWRASSRTQEVQRRAARGTTSFFSSIEALDARVFRVSTSKPARPNPATGILPQ